MRWPFRRRVVIALVDEPARPRSPEVIAELIRGSAPSLLAAVAALESSDVVVLQHEFGIYGGEDGCDVLDLVAGLRAPIIVVLHTVLHSPSWRQQAIIEELSAAAERVVVQSETARTRLLELYDVPAEHVAVVPHGASRNPSAHVVRDPGRRPMILTWGLLGPGKGIEFAIDALAELRDLDPAPRYSWSARRIRTCLLAQGEAYRDSLRARAGRAVSTISSSSTTATATRHQCSRRFARPTSCCSRMSRATRSYPACSSRRSPRESRSSRRRSRTLSSCSRVGSGILVPHEDPAAIARALRASTHRSTPCRRSRCRRSSTGRAAPLGERRQEVPPARSVSRSLAAQVPSVDGPDAARSHTSCS